MQDKPELDQPDPRILALNDILSSLDTFIYSQVVGGVIYEDPLIQVQEALGTISFHIEENRKKNENQGNLLCLDTFRKQKQEQQKRNSEERGKD